jgi:hypothetical protein
LKRRYLGKRRTQRVQLARKQLLAELMSEFVTTGRATMPDGRVLDAAPKDWIETVKWVYTHIDGPPKQEIEQSGGLTIRVEYVDNTDTDQLPRPHSGQRRILQDMRRFNVLACGRRFGKTTFGIERLVRPALEGYPVAWFSPTYKMLSEVWRTFSLILGPSSGASTHRSIGWNS